MAMTAAMRCQLQRTNDPDGILLFLLIDSPYLSAPVRVVQDTRDWIVGGETFVGLPISINPPQDVAKETPRAAIEMDNIGRDMFAELEGLPVGTALEVTLRTASRARPEIVEWEFTGDMSKASANWSKVGIDVGDDTRLRGPAVLLRADPATIPGIFEG